MTDMPRPRFRNRPFAWLLALPVRAYRVVGSPWVGHNCRYYPTCSAYTLEALERHGAVKGGALAFWRVLRCNPWGGSGEDPVPGKGTNSECTTCKS